MRMCVPRWVEEDWAREKRERDRNEDKTWPPHSAGVAGTGKWGRIEHVACICARVCVCVLVGNWRAGVTRSI